MNGMIEACVFDSHSFDSCTRVARDEDGSRQLNGHVSSPSTAWRRSHPRPNGKRRIS